MVNKAYEYLKEKILHFELIQGDVISDYVISKQLGVSRTPVREAIRMLEHYGLVERNGSRMVVTSITVNDIKEIFDVREAIEVMAIKRLFRDDLITDTFINKVKKAVKRNQEYILKNDWEQNYNTDEEFHHTIVDAAGNKRMTQFSEVMRLQMHRARWLTSVIPNCFEKTMTEHEEILNCFLNRDEEGASNAVCKHLESSKNSFESVLASKQLLMMLGSVNSILR